MVKKVCVVTGARSEYGLLKYLIRGIDESTLLDLSVLATGTHLSAEFGNTYREIEDDGFDITKKIEILLSSDSPTGVTKSMGLGMIGAADALSEMQPDLLLVLGDRYEIFSIVAAAMIHRIPVAHIHGGESTEGVIDESIRHSITKMSHLHFVATESYRRRVIQLGERPERVFCVGGMGVDCISQTSLLPRTELESMLGFHFGERCLMITFHPVTLEPASAEAQMTELLKALEEISESNFIFTMPNGDTDGRVLFQLIADFVERHAQRARAFTSLGQLRYLSCLQFVDAVVGNSSSGLLEVPSFFKPTVNIGDRQRGRVKAASVIDCGPTQNEIKAAIYKALSNDFRVSLATLRNPYGSGGASKKIIQILENTQFNDLLKKSFYDLSST